MSTFSTLLPVAAALAVVLAAAGVVRAEAGVVVWTADWGDCDPDKDDMLSLF